MRVPQATLPARMASTRGSKPKPVRFNSAEFSTSSSREGAFRALPGSCKTSNRTIEGVRTNRTAAMTVEPKFGAFSLREPGEPGFQENLRKVAQPRRARSGSALATRPCHRSAGRNGPFLFLSRRSTHLQEDEPQAEGTRAAAQQTPSPPAAWSIPGSPSSASASRRNTAARRRCAFACGLIA